MDYVFTLNTLACTIKEKVQANFDNLLLETKTFRLLCISVCIAYGSTQGQSLLPY